MISKSRLPQASYAFHCQHVADRRPCHDSRRGDAERAVGGMEGGTVNIDVYYAELLIYAETENAGFSATSTLQVTSSTFAPAQGAKCLAKSVLFQGSEVSASVQRTWRMLMSEYVDVVFSRRQAGSGADLRAFGSISTRRTIFSSTPCSHMYIHAATEPRVLSRAIPSFTMWWNT